MSNIKPLTELTFGYFHKKYNKKCFSLCYTFIINTSHNFQRNCYMLPIHFSCVGTFSLRYPKGCRKPRPS